MGLQDLYNKVLRKEKYTPKGDLVRLYEGTSLPDFKKSVKDVYEAIRGYDDHNAAFDKIAQDQELRKAATASTPTTTPPEQTHPVAQQQQQQQQPQTQPVASYPFLSNTPRTSKVAWTEVQAALYNHRPTDSIGPGEYSIAAMLLNFSDPKANGLSKEEIIKKIDELKMVQGPGKSKDVVFPSANNEKYKYEVKGLSDTEQSDRTGQAGSAAVRTFLNSVQNGIAEIYSRYATLDAETKNKLNSVAAKDKTGRGYSLEEILSASKVYFTSKVGELPMGIYNPNTRTREHVPRLYLLPELFAKLNQTEDVQNALTTVDPEEVEWLSDLYKVSKQDARDIDLIIRNYITKKYPNRQDIIPLLKLNDFIKACNDSIFSTPEKFYNNVTAYMTPGTEQNTELAKRSLPVDGLFIAEPDGYSFVGHDHLEGVVRMDKITGGSPKIGIITTQPVTT